MFAQRITSQLRLKKAAALQAILLLFLFVWCVFGIVSSTAQSPQKAERELEDKIPKHLPINLRVKNPDKVKDLNNETWLHDLEIEIENKSTKPIYYLRLVIDLPEVITENNRELGFPLQYGRAALISFSAPLQQDDVPIKPGESYIFKVPEQLLQGWESFTKRRNLAKKAPKKFRLIFQVLSFGDGTGFITTGGLPMDVHKKRANNSCVEDDKKERRAASLASKPLYQYLAQYNYFFTGKLSAGKFFSSK